jgi:hypothetical protein
MEFVAAAVGLVIDPQTVGAVAGNGEIEQLAAADDGDFGIPGVENADFRDQPGIQLPGNDTDEQPVAGLGAELEPHRRVGLDPLVDHGVGSQFRGSFWERIGGRDGQLGDVSNGEWAGIGGPEAPDDPKFA